MACVRFCGLLKLLSSKEKLLLLNDKIWSNLQTNRF